jgi:hypothetical protein
VGVADDAGGFDGDDAAELDADWLVVVWPVVLCSR